MTITRCPHCAEFVHSDDWSERVVCWNCGGSVRVDYRTTWDQRLSRGIDRWIQSAIIDSGTAFWLGLPFALWLLLQVLVSLRH